MTSMRLKHSKEGFGVIEPTNDFGHSFGYYMVTNPKGQILRLYKLTHIREATAYCDYCALSKFGKLKYWLHYKRGNKKF